MKEKKMLLTPDCKEILEFQSLLNECRFDLNRLEVVNSDFREQIKDVAHLTFQGFDNSESIIKFLFQITA